MLPSHLRQLKQYSTHSNNNKQSINKQDYDNQDIEQFMKASFIKIYDMALA